MPSPAKLITSNQGIVPRNLIFGCLLRVLPVNLTPYPRPHPRQQFISTLRISLGAVRIISVASRCRNARHSEIYVVLVRTLVCAFRAVASVERRLK